ncbi:hypothetical protein DFH07DRAFT_977320 [Mycena maculata]|uniref:Uncharacterized protein n=1 Tax=Mycena maculata TaxID=230809 RepID=A0AAD7N416_9AGAR|nr:hypothetical protein DFH07DRAFT_977320 [Mycena maculata]
MWIHGCLILAVVLTLVPAGPGVTQLPAPHHIMALPKPKTAVHFMCRAFEGPVITPWEVRSAVRTRFENFQWDVCAKVRTNRITFSLDTIEPEYRFRSRRHFNIIPHCTAALGTVCFNSEHLPANSFLALLPKDESVRPLVEIGLHAHKIFEELVCEKEVLAKAVSSLNTVQRKGQVNVHITQLPEDDCEEN